jgi:hypothetical protein
MGPSKFALLSLNSRPNFNMASQIAQKTNRGESMMLVSEAVKRADPRSLIEYWLY